VIFWRFLAAKMNYDEMDGDGLRLPANRNCYRLSRVSWALLKFLVSSKSQIQFANVSLFAHCRTDTNEKRRANVNIKKVDSKDIYGDG